MTTKHPSTLVKGPYATYDLPMMSILWAAAMVNFKTSPTNDIWNRSQHRKEQGHD